MDNEVPLQASEVLSLDSEVTSLATQIHYNPCKNGTSTMTSPHLEDEAFLKTSEVSSPLVKVLHCPKEKSFIALRKGLNRFQTF